jgi:hypothetical protein
MSAIHRVFGLTKHELCRGLSRGIALSVEPSIGPALQLVAASLQERYLSQRLGARVCWSITAPAEDTLSTDSA